MAASLLVHNRATLYIYYTLRAKLRLPFTSVNDIHRFLMQQAMNNLRQFFQTIHIQHSHWQILTKCEAISKDLHSLART